MTYGEALRKAREIRGISQNFLSKRLGVSQAFISAIEMGQKKPSLNISCRINDYLGIVRDGEEWNCAQPQPDIDPEIEGRYINPETIAIARRISEDPTYKMLFNASEDTSPEDLLKAIKIVKIMSSGRKTAKEVKSRNKTKEGENE